MKTFAMLAAALLACVPPAAARVTRIVIDDVVTPAFCKGEACAAYGSVGQYEQIAGRAFGELDPADARNALIQDLALARDGDGKVRYVATFVITKPRDMRAASGLLWHDVPNRGRPVLLDAAERARGDVGLASAWQGDNASMGPGLGTALRATMTAGANHWLQLPVARQADGTPITGRVFGRIVNRSGAGAQPLLVQTNPVPYFPATLDTRAAQLVSRTGETMDGVVSGETAIAPQDWQFCGGGTFERPEPLTRLPVQICLRGGFDPEKLYQVVYTARDPYVLGIGFAAWRDVAAFFKYAERDDLGTPNPLAGRITHSIARGRSQSGNFLRGWLHLGFNETEAGRQAHDGLWPIIAGRRIALNLRWAQPDGVLELYQAGSEGPQWWMPAPDTARGLPARSLLDRCHATRTCPRIMEHYGSTELWGLKLGPSWIGTAAQEDLPLPDNVRRYYIASSTHGGGAGGFDSSLPAAGGAQAKTLQCPGNNAGTAALPANPVPHAETVRALSHHFRNWVMHDIAPPASRWPTLARGELVAPERTALKLPALPGVRPGAPEAGFMNPLLDYDWGPEFDANDGSGVATRVPPAIRRVIPTLVPRVDADGNEVGGVPVVLLDAPLGTYLGWNITADGFHRGKLCTYAGGMVPFARTRAERMANGDSRPSLEERYGDHAGYVAAVRTAAGRAEAAGFLLPADAAALIAAAERSRVLR